MSHESVLCIRRLKGNFFFKWQCLFSYDLLYHTSSFLLVCLCLFNKLYISFSLSLSASISFRYLRSSAISIEIGIHIKIDYGKPVSDLCWAKIMTTLQNYTNHAN